MPPIVDDPYIPVSFTSLGAGLNLRDKVDAISEEECIDALNVEFTERGAVRQRAGYSQFTASPLTNPVGSLEPYYTTAGTVQLVAGCGTRLEAIDTSGAVVDSETGLTTGTWDFARFGTPGAERIYAGQGSGLLYEWDGATWDSVAATPQGGALAVMPTSNRLVVGRFNGTAGGPTGGASTSSPSHLYLCDPGDPFTWGTDNFVVVTPGDGEKIQAVIAWREFVFVFKETKFFRFQGESIDGGGEPVFDYTAIDTGHGCVSPRAVCADETGVYFLSRTGVMRTTGGDPERVSEAIRPIFDGGASSYYLGGELLHSQITNSAMWSHNERIYLSFTITGTTNTRTLVYDPHYGWWSLWDVPASCGASFRISSTPEMAFGFAATSNDIGRHRASETNDDGTAITSRWRSGWFDYDDPDRKRIAESKVWGSGSVFMGLSHDYDVGVGALTELDLTDPTVDTWGGSTWGGGEWSVERGLLPALRRKSAAGTQFSTYFQNTTLDQSWAVHRVTHHLGGKRIPSVVNA